MSKIRNIALTDSSLVDVRDAASCSTPLIDYVKLILKELNVSFKDLLCITVGDAQECIELEINNTVTTENCNGIEATGSGTALDPLVICPVIDANPCNLLSTSEDGLLVLQALSASLTDGILSIDFGCEESEDIDLSGLYEFDNALTKTGNLVQFGGDFVKDTTIDLDGFDWIIEGDDIYLTDYDGDTRDDSAEHTPLSFLYTDENGKLLEAPISLLAPDISDSFQNDLGWNAITEKIEQGYPLTKDTDTDLVTYYRKWHRTGGTAQNILKLFANGDVDFGWSGASTTPFEHYDMQYAVKSPSYLRTDAVAVTRYKGIDNVTASSTHCPIRWYNSGTSTQAAFEFIGGSESNANGFDRSSLIRVWRGIGSHASVRPAETYGIYAEGYNADSGTGGETDLWGTFTAVNVGGYIQPTNADSRLYQAFQFNTIFNTARPASSTRIDSIALNIIPDSAEVNIYNLVGINFAPVNPNIPTTSTYTVLQSTRGNITMGNADGKSYFRFPRFTQVQIDALSPTITATYIGGESVFNIDTGFVNIWNHITSTWIEQS
jgi:hypothetical protein